MNKYEYYIDFLSEYKLTTTNYLIYDNGKEYYINTKSYEKYKDNRVSDYKISVVIPIHNNEKFIHRTLMSIENQTFGIDNIEVLMIDDSSIDNTYNVIKDYADNYSSFKAIHIENGTKSPGTPRNIGIFEASSDFIMFLDHDDLFDIGALERLYNSIVETNSDLVYGTYASVDGDIPTKIIFPNEKHGYFKNISENERCIAFPPPSIWTKIFRTSFLIDNNILFPTILGEDAIFLSKALMNAEGINYLWDSLICYHVLDEKSRTNNISYNYLLEGFISEEYMYNFYKDNGNENYYKIRGEGILDFYLTQFYKSNLTKNELLNIFPLLYKFIVRLNKFGLSPHMEDINIVLFNCILEKDLDYILKCKNLNSDNHNLIKNIFKRIGEKLNFI